MNTVADLDKIDELRAQLRVADEQLTAMILKLEGVIFHAGVAEFMRPAVTYHHRQFHQRVLHFLEWEKRWCFVVRAEQDAGTGRWTKVSTLPPDDKARLVEQIPLMIAHVPMEMEWTLKKMTSALTNAEQTLAMIKGWIFPEKKP